MKFYFFITVLLVSICGCSNLNRSDTVSTIMLNDNEIIVSYLDKLKADTVEILLSDLVEGCELVQLEYTEEALFQPWKTTITEKYIGITQEERYRGSYKLFSRSGKFLCNIGSIGQGPGEYFLICDDVIDEKNELIYLAPFIGTNKILVYNTSGRFLKNIEMPQLMIGPQLFLSGDTLTVAYIGSTNDKSMVSQINIKSGQVLNDVTTQIPQLGYTIFYNSRNMQHIFDITHSAYDTLYHFNNSNCSLRPIFAMSGDLYEKPFKDHCQLNKHFVLTTIRNKGLIATDLKHKRSSWAKVKNDYFGNLVVPYATDIFYNGYFVYNIQPEQLMEEIKKRLSESSCTEKDRQELQKTLSTLKEDTNNVVFIGKLKNGIERRLF